MTLGCLLADELGIALEVTPSGRFHFGEGEFALSRWMAQHAFVTWVPTPEPWWVEEAAIQQLDLPLNLQKNGHNAFFERLTAARKSARLAARRRAAL